MKFSEEWYEVLKDKIGDDFFFNAQKFVDDESKKGLVFPPREEVYSAYNLVSPKDVKVVILGQDPYHEIGQAHGLCFSVKNNTPHLLLSTFIRRLKRTLVLFPAKMETLRNGQSKVSFC